MIYLSNIISGNRNGKARLWLQNHFLSRIGFQKGSQYRIDYRPEEHGIDIILCDDGNKVVCGKAKQINIVSVIDINNKQLSSIIGINKKVSVAYFQSGVIKIRLHNIELRKVRREDRLTQKLKSGEQLLSASFFHGGGILDHAVHCGLEKGGLSTQLRLAVERDDKYIASSVRNNPVINDNTLVVQSDLHDLADLNLPNVDIVLAGIPCTGASVAGKSKNKLKHAEQHQDSGSVFIPVLNIINKINPAIIILENVKAYANTLSFSLIKDILCRAGYSLQEIVLNGFDFGSLEKRERLIVVAMSSGVCFNLSAIPALIERPNNLSEILEDVSENDSSWKTYSYLNKKAITDKAAGKGFTQQIVPSTAESVGVINRTYHKVQSTPPRLQHPHDDTLNRLFTPGEHARIKNVPENLISDLPATTAHEILGQGVCWGAFFSLGEWLAKTLKASIEDGKLLVNISSGKNGQLRFSL